MNLGAYRVVSEISRGGMGIVFKALASDGSAVAVKLLRSPRPDALARFDRERRLMESLGAAGGFVPVLEAGMAPQGAFIVMPLVEGGTLRDRLGRGPLSQEETLSLGRFLATTIAAAHERSIVHRDLKPENILFTGEGRPLVADLGVAKHFDGDAPGASRSVSLSRSGVLLGTAGYMPREQMRDAKSAGPEADVFAIGAILYECLAGAPAFVGDNALALITLVERGTVRPLPGLRPDVPRWLAAVVERALARDPAARHADARELAEALNTLPLPPASRLLPVAALALALLGLLAVGATALLLRAPASAPPQKATAPPPAMKPRVPLRAFIGSGDPSLVIDPVGEMGLELECRARPATPRGQALLETACRQAEEGDLGAAIRTCGELIAAEPGNAVGWFKRGIFQAIVAHQPDAEADLTKAAALAPDDPHVIGDRGQLRRGRGNPGDARPDLDRAIELDGRSVVFLISRAELRYKAGELDAAVSDADTAIAADRSCARAWLMRAGFFLGQGDAARADQDASNAIERQPGLALAWLTRSEARSTLGRMTEALADAEHAVTLAPRDPTAWAALGTVHHVVENYTESLKDLDRSLELDGTVASTWLRRAIVRTELHDSDGVIADSTRAIELDPGDSVAWGYRAEARLMKRQFDEAIADAGRAIELAPTYASGYLTRGQALIAKGTLDRALPDLDRSIAIEKTYLALGARASVKLLLGDKGGALADANDAVTLQPGFARGYHTRGFAREALGDVVGALEDYDHYLGMPHARAASGVEDREVVEVRKAAAALRARK